MSRAVPSLIIMSFVIASSTASAQSRRIETGAHVSVLRVSEVDATDAGVGGYSAWFLTPDFAIDGALTWFPDESRVLGLAGVQPVVGYRNVELFAQARAGFLRFVAQDSVVCIAVVPAPLACQLAAGYTALAADFGGGASFGVTGTPRLRIHVEASDLLVRYGLEVRRPSGEITHAFVSHNPLISVSVGWRF
jgi:hypothetical protein